MPATPSTWLDEFTVNLTTTNAQSRPRITQLANGNILVSWESTDDSGVGSPSGTDLIGQIFNSQGERIGVEFLVNANSNGSNERDHDTAAIATTGGFVTVYERNTGTFNDIQLSEHDSTGAVVNTVNIFFDGTSGADPSGFDPRVAVNSAGVAMVVWRETIDASNSRIMARSYDTATNTLGTATSVIAFSGGNFTPDIAALTNGNFVIVDSHDDAGDREIVIRIINPTMGNVLSVIEIVSTEGDGHSDTTPTVTALTGGGFVVAWANTDSTDSDIEAQVFNAAGTAVSSLITLPLGNADDNANEPVVVALNDGGFVILFDEDTDAQLRGQRYDSAGSQVGSEFVISTGSAITSIDAKLLGDGRFAVTFLTDSGEIGMEILDIRDTPNGTGVYTPADQIVGTIGNDVFTADAAENYGHDGDDTITDGSGLNNIYGGAGNDRITILSVDAGEDVDGGAGVNTLVGFNMSAGTIYNLLTGTVTQGSSSQNVTSFRDVIGSSADETFIGDAQNNRFEGSGGNDLMVGDAGNDVLFSGFGNDTVRGGIGEDRLSGGAGDDRMIGNVGNDTLSGAVGNDLLFGASENDQLLGGDGSDSLNGETGDDRLAGDAGNDTLEGSTGNDRLDGGIGNDILRGSADNDTLIGGDGQDVLTGGSGNDVMTGGANADSFVFGVGFGVDRITDFSVINTVEKIDLSAIAAITGFADLAANHLSQVAGNAVITVGTNTITLVGVSSASLTASDFLF